MNSQKQQHEQRGKVLMLGPELLDQGGMAAVVHTILGAWDNGRYTVKYIGTYNTNARQIVKPWLAIRAFLYFLYLMIFWRPHILHLHAAAGVSFFRKSIFILLARFSRAKVLFHSHAPNFDAFYSKCPRRVQAYVRLVLNSCDALIVLSNYWDSFFRGLSLQTPIVTLYNSAVCPPPILRPPTDKPIVLFLGRLGRRKGTYDLLKAIPDVLAQHPHTQFWLGGDGEVEQAQHIISAAPWGQQVKLLGWVRAAEKDKALQQANLFLLPSYQEGFPVAVLEAMSYGLPVISTPVGGIPELVIDGETGFLISPGDVAALVEKINLLLSDSTLREQMGGNGRQHIQEKFDTKTMIQELFALYEAHTKQAHLSRS